MKLDKAICKRCINKHRFDLLGNNQGWDINDEYRWNNEAIICKGIETDIDYISKKCPYNLEHVVNYES